MRISIYFIFLSLLTFSCDLWKGEITSKEDDRIPVARAGTHYLYEEDLKGLVSEEISTNDSIVIAQNYIESWVKQKLLLDMAVNQLQDSSDEIDQRLKDYRESLFTYQFEQEYLNQNLDTVITDQQIENYYSEYKENFKLTDHIGKFISITIKNDYPKQDSIHYWLNNIEDEYLHLEKYCVETSADCWLQEDVWKSYTGMTSQIPGINLNALTKGRVSLHTKDDIKSYILLLEFIPKNQNAPLEFKRDEIEKILINKKRIDLIKRLNDEVYDDAVRKNKFEIY